MKNVRLYFPLLVGLIWMVQPCATRAEVVDKVVAVVNDEPITQSELDVLLSPIYEQYKAVYQGQEFVVKMNEARRNLLNQLIEDRLVFQESKRLGVEVTEEEVNERIAELKSRFPSEEEFKKLLEHQGLTLKQLKKRYEEQIAIRKLHQYEIRTRVVISPKDIEDYYNAHQKDFVDPEKIKISTIMIRKSLSEPLITTQEAAGSKATLLPPVDPGRQKVDEIAERLKKGEDFTVLAKEHSEESHAAVGGEVGWVAQGDMIPEMEQILFQLKPGDLSPVLESPVGYHIFRIEDKRPSKARTLEEVRPEIQEILFRKKSRERFEKWMNGLKSHAYISVR